MDINEVNKYFDTSTKPRSYKGWGKALTIWSLIVIAISMITIWGTVCSAHTYMGSYYGSNIHMGIEAYVYDGWKILSFEHAEGYRYAMFVILILLFIGTLFVTYFFGVKAFVKGLRNVANKEDYKIFPYVLIIMFANLIYFNLGNSLAQATFACSSGSVGWGKLCCGLVMVPLFIGIIIFNMIASFDKEKIPEFVGKVFLVISICFCVAIMDNVVAGYFDAAQAEVGMYYPFGVVATGSVQGGTAALFIIQGIICLVTYFLAFYTGIKTIIYITTDFPQKKPLALVAPFALLILSAISMFTNGITAELAPADINVTVSDEVIGSFVCAVVMATFYLTNYFINNKEEDEQAA